ncbi:MAG: thioredoxin domain-containing protein [Flavobacteriales bacterium]|nr:thioredoxin domain-containing protein [Flavobacteriales bacterium]
MKFFTGYLLASFFVINSCSTQEVKEPHLEEQKHLHTNNLINETSPYLLQHAHNPVNWNAWNDETLQRAKDENKPLLISIGYSACHWCHVMEHESFEDEGVAKIMNEQFIPVKIDREERPDIDQIYMNAIQLIKQSGGWPLNCIALPDGRPFFCGTYFQKEQWKKALNDVSNAYANRNKEVVDYAEKLSQGIRQSELIKINKSDPVFERANLETIVEGWSEKFDLKEGGNTWAPKFPMPNNYLFLLRYYNLTKDQSILDFVNLTLEKMALGGIYDQIGGGFARYSTDKIWKAPHFEKMLYDNGQLVSLYSEAYNLTRNPLYKEVITGTLEFVEREMTSPVGSFYSALDADSEGEEGKYYVWTKEDLKSILGSDFDLFAKYYNIGGKALWEHGNNILLRDIGDAKFAAKEKIDLKKLQNFIKEQNKILLQEREKRVHPGLDDKCLTSWNALMLKGYVDAYNVLGNEKHLDIAVKNGNYIIKHQIQKNGPIYHSYKNGRTTINGYLEDYSFTIEAFIALYEATFDEKWINQADQLAQHAIEHFFDSESKMFFFTSDLDKKLIARKMEVNDNVIPASCSSMAKSLFKLGLLLDNKDYSDKSIQMLNNVKDDMQRYASGYSNWGILMTNKIMPYYEIAILGNDFKQKRNELFNLYVPNKLLMGSKKESELPLLKNKYQKGSTMIYVCLDKTCKMPTEEPSKALNQMNH